MKELQGRVAVVTGAGSGIGEAIARACAGEGMRIVVADLEEKEAARVSDAIRGDGGRAVSAEVDVTHPESLRALAERTWTEFGACHLLVNNAGVVVMGRVEQCSAEDFEWVLGVNLRGVIHGVQAFLPRMLEQEGERHILNTGSISGLCALPLVGVYTTSKYGVVGFSEVLHTELAPRGIGVSVLCPGGVRTRLLESERNRPAQLQGRAVSDEDIQSVSDSAGDRPETAMEPEAVARAALEGVRAGDLFIVTHPAMWDLVEQRHAALRAAFERAQRREGG